MQRRAFLRLGGLTGVCILGGTPYRMLSGLVRSDVPPAIERLYYTLGTLVRFQVYHDDEGNAVQAIREAAEQIHAVQRLMSVQDPTSELAIWNRSAYGSNAPFGVLTAAALDEAFRIKAQTDGRFDPFIGEAVVAYEKGARWIPSADRSAHWDARNRRCRKADPSLAIDLGGSAKGLAVDLAVSVLRRRGIKDALVNAGGDLRVIGAPPNEGSWRIGIRDPSCGSGILGVLTMRDGAVATSGDYERSGSTLVDPRDLSTVQLNGSVTVIGPTCGMADGLATALCVESDFSLLPARYDGLVAVRKGTEFVLTATSGFAAAWKPGLVLHSSEAEASHVQSSIS